MFQFRKTQNSFGSFGSFRNNFKILAISRVILFGAIAFHYSSWIFDFSTFFHFADSNNQYYANTLLGLMIIFSMSACVGYYAQFACLMVLGLHAYFLWTSMLMYWGWGFLLIPILSGFACMKSDWYLTLKRKRIFPTFPVMAPMLVSFLCCLYFTSNYRRYIEPEWISGEVLYYLLLNPMYSRFAAMDLSSIRSIIEFASRLAWVIEMFGIFLIFMPIKSFRIYLGVLLFICHFMLLVSSKIQIWSFVCVSLLLLACIDFPWDIHQKKKVFSGWILSISVFIFYSGLTVLSSDYPKYIMPQLYGSVLGPRSFGGMLGMHLFTRSGRKISTVVEAEGQSDDSTSIMLFRSDIEKSIGLKNSYIFEPFQELIERYRLGVTGINSRLRQYNLPTCEIFATKSHVTNLKNLRLRIRFLKVYEPASAIEEKFEIAIDCSDGSASNVSKSEDRPLLNLSGLYRKRLEALGKENFEIKTLPNSN